MDNCLLRNIVILARHGARISFTFKYNFTQKNI